MTDDSIKLELARLITEAEALESKLVRHHIDYAKWFAQGSSSEPPERLMEEKDEVERLFEHFVTSIYLATICLLDCLHLHAYLNQFYLRFGEKTFDARNATEDFKIDPHEPWDSYSVFLSNVKQFLEPLNVLQDKSRYLKLTGIKYLETILNNTAAIIHASGKSPTSEPQVYGIVRDVVRAVFPSAINATSNFLHTTKEFNPDILIPELFVAVEYKYAASQAKLKETLEEIAADVKGYTGDDRYNLFYAVFYVTRDFWGKEKFNHAWNDMKFPENWRAIYIVG